MDAPFRSVSGGTPAHRDAGTDPPRRDARTFTRRYVLDLPLYTAPLALLLLGIGWQLERTRLPPFVPIVRLSPGDFVPVMWSTAAIALGVAGSAVVYQRLLPVDETLGQRAACSLERLATLLILLMVATAGLCALVLFGPLALAVPGPGPVITFPGVWWALLTTACVLGILRAQRLIVRLPARNLPASIMVLTYSVLVAGFLLVVSDTFLGRSSETLPLLAILIPIATRIRSWERSVLATNRSPVAAAVVLTLGFALIQELVAGYSPTLPRLLSLLSLLSVPVLLFAAAFMVRRRALAKTDARPYALLPAGVLCLLCLAPVLAADPTSQQSLSPVVFFTTCFAWFAFFIYAFFFVSPLPWLLIVADRPGMAIQGASYVDFRRLSRLGVPEALADRGMRAIGAAIVLRLGRQLQVLPARLAPWLAVPLVSAILMPPWNVWLDGVSLAPLALPAAVWAAARWGRRAMAPLAVALVPHVIGIGLFMREGQTAVLALTGDAGFIASLLFWARFTADADLRRRLMTQERFGAGALLALALVAGFGARGSFLSVDAAKTVLALNLVWIATSLVIVWGLSRAPVGQAICVLLALVGLRFALYDLAVWPTALHIPMRLGTSTAYAIIEAPLFGLSRVRAAGLVLLILIARFALRQGMSARAHHNTRFSSALSRNAGAALAIVLLAASPDAANPDPGPIRGGLADSTIDMAAWPQDPFLIALGVILGLWLPQSLWRLPRDLLVGWAPLGVVIGIGLVMVQFQLDGTSVLAATIDALTTPRTLASIAFFFVFIVFGRMVRRAAGGWAQTAQPPHATGHEAPPSTAALYAGPSAMLNDLLGRDTGTPLARVIDATFCVPQARHLKQPGITARILTNAAPKPFAEVFATPSPASSPARLVLGGVGATLLVLGVALAIVVTTAGIRQALRQGGIPPTATDTPLSLPPELQGSKM